MSRNELARVAVIGASCVAALFLFAETVQTSDPSSATSLLGAMGFALAAAIESDGDASWPTFLLHAIRPVAKTPSSVSEGNGPAGVAELVDALDLGSSDSRRGGSSPSARTIPTDHGVAHARNSAGSPRRVGGTAASFGLLSVAETVIRLTDYARSRH